MMIEIYTGNMIHVGTLYGIDDIVYDRTSDLVSFKIGDITVFKLDQGFYKKVK